MPSSTFQPGNPGGPGRPKGSRNKLSEAFLEAVQADFQEHGAAAIEAARIESPLGYVHMIAGLLPQKLEVDQKRRLVDFTDAELAVLCGNDDDAEPLMHGGNDEVH